MDRSLCCLARQGEVHYLHLRAIGIARLQAPALLGVGIEADDPGAIPKLLPGISEAPSAADVDDAEGPVEQVKHGGERSVGVNHNDLRTAGRSAAVHRIATS